MGGTGSTGATTGTDNGFAANVDVGKALLRADYEGALVLLLQRVLFVDDDGNEGGDVDEDGDRRQLPENGDTATNQSAANHTLSGMDENRPRQQPRTIPATPKHLAHPTT